MNMQGNDTEKDEDVKVQDMSATVTDLEDFLTELRDRNTPINEHEVIHIQE